MEWHRAFQPFRLSSDANTKHYRDLAADEHSHLGTQNTLFLSMFGIVLYAKWTCSKATVDFVQMGNSKSQMVHGKGYDVIVLCHSGIILIGAVVVQEWGEVSSLSISEKEPPKNNLYALGSIKMSS